MVLQQQIATLEFLQEKMRARPSTLASCLLGCNLKINRKISVHFQGKPFNITVNQVNAPTTDAKEAEIEQFYDELQDLP